MDKPLAKASEGDFVRVRCTGQTLNGQIFDMSRGNKALEVILGHGDLLPAVERQFIGMSPGESKQFFLPMNEAYGPRRDDLIQIVDRDYFPPGILPKIGLTVKVPTVGYDTFTATIVNITETHLTLDGNHPLAGQDVTFFISLLDIVEF